MTLISGQRICLNFKIIDSLLMLLCRSNSPHSKRESFWFAFELKTSSCVWLSWAPMWVSQQMVSPLPVPRFIWTHPRYASSSWTRVWCVTSCPMPPLSRTGSPSSLCQATWPSYWRKTSIGWWMMPTVPLLPASAPFPSGCPSVMTGITSTLTCSGRICHWLRSNSSATWGDTQAHWRATSCARSSWIPRCGSHYPSSAARRSVSSWWRSTLSSAWLSLTLSKRSGVRTTRYPLQLSHEPSKSPANVDWLPYLRPNWSVTFKKTATTAIHTVTWTWP